MTAPSKMGRKHNSNLITTGSRYKYVNFHGGSKPPPYHVVVCFVSLATAFGCLSLTMQLLLFRKNHARLACSVVNALTTARCRYQLLRISDRGKSCPYGTILISHSRTTAFLLFFNDMPRSVRRDIFTFGKSDIATSSQ